MITAERLAANLANDGAYQRIEGGEKGCLIFRINYKDERAVLKTGKIGQEDGKEVRDNLRAYEEMANLGISSLISPIILGEGEIDGLAYLILEDAGQNFRKSATEKNIEQMSNTLINTLGKAYLLSRRNSPTNSIEWLTGIRDHIVRYFTQYLEPAGYVDKRDIETVREFRPETIAPKQVAWATADLTPDNVFIKRDRTIVIDSKPNCLGVPLIDLAMFSTLTREIYSLPNGQRSAELIERLGRDLNELFEIQEEQGIKLFKLGEARQYTLSARFRIGKDPRAKMFAQKAVERIREIK